MKESTVKYKPNCAVKPGETIHDLLEEHKMSMCFAAHKLGMPVEIFLDVLAAKKKITPKLASKLEALFGVNAEFWISLQANYDSDIRKNRRRNDQIY